MKDRVPPCESRVSKCSVHGSVGLFERHRLCGVFLSLPAYTDNESEPKGETFYEDRCDQIAADPTAGPAPRVWDQKAEKELIDRQGETEPCTVSLCAACYRQSDLWYHKK